MMNEEQSAGTIAGQSTEAEVTNVSHNNGNTHVGCSLFDVSTGTKYKSISQDLYNENGDKTTEVPRVTKRIYNERGQLIEAVMLVDEGVLPITGKELWNELRPKDSEQV